MLNRIWLRIEKVLTVDEIEPLRQQVTSKYQDIEYGRPLLPWKLEQIERDIEHKSKSKCCFEILCCETEIEMQEKSKECEKRDDFVRWIT